MREEAPVKMAAVAGNESLGDEALAFVNSIDEVRMEANADSGNALT